MKVTAVIINHWSNSVRCVLDKILLLYSALVGCVSEGNELENRSVIRDFVDWCEHNLLCLNSSKTKEMLIDFRKRPLRPAPMNIQGSDVELVDSYRIE